MEEEVTKVVFNVLSKDPMNEHVKSPDQLKSMNFMKDLYMESLLFVDLVSTLEKEFDYTTPYDQMDMESYGSIKDICQLIEKAKEETK